MNTPDTPAVSRVSSWLRLGLLSSVLIAFSALSAHADPASLLPDGSLEKANSSGEWPVGWGRSKDVSWESEAGNFFFRLTSPAPGAHVSLYHKATLPSGTKALELSFRARVEGLEVGVERWYDARIIMNFRDSTGKVIGAKPTPYYNRPTNGWVVAVHRIEVPADAVTIEFLPSLFRAASGVFDLDDIVLKPISGPAAP